MRIIYIVCLLWAIIILLAYLYYNTKAMDSLIGIMFFAVVIYNWGTIMLSTSKTVEEALLAKKVTYFGSSIIAPALLILIFSICNINVHKVVKLFIYILACISYGLTATIGRGDLYYTNERIVRRHGVTILKKDGEILRTIYFCVLGSFIVVSIVVVIYSYIKKINVSKHNITLLTSMAGITLGLFLISRMIKSDLEITPIVLVIDASILLYIMERLSLYNVENSVVKALLEEKSLVYLVLDKDRRFIASNDIANSIFPEISNFKVDERIEVKKAGLFSDLEAWLDEMDRVASNDVMIKSRRYGDTAYEFRIKHMYYLKRVMGYIVEISDVTDKQNYLELIEKYNTELEDEVTNKTKHILEMQDNMLFAVGNMVENRDMNTGGHINRTSYVVGVLLDEIKRNNEIEINDEYIKNVIKVAPLHDLGKISIEDSILRKPGKLTDEEFSEMKTHSVKGAKIVENILKDIEDEELIKIAVNIAKYHHEKWNGCGYPEKLSGEDIPFEARVMAVADVYDALVSDRCYKKKMSFEEANSIMLESMGSHFDPSLEKYYLNVKDKLEEFYSMGDAVEV